MSAKLLDRVLETPIAPSFTRIGAVVRSRTEHWTDLDDYDLSGRTILLTGATSGLGLAAAHRLAHGRDGARARLGPLEVPAAPADDLVLAVAAPFQPRARARHDGAVGVCCELEGHEGERQLLALARALTSASAIGKRHLVQQPGHPLGTLEPEPAGAPRPPLSKRNFCSPSSTRLPKHGMSGR